MKKRELTTAEKIERKSYYSKLFILANRMVKEAKGGMSRKECFAEAKRFLQETEEEVYILEAFSVKGEFSRRCVLTNWHQHNTVKGTGRPTKPGQILFVDLAAKLAESRRGSTRSFYEKNIENLYSRVPLAA